MTEERLRELFSLWIPRLGLDLWDIEVRIEDPELKTNMMQVRRSTSYNRAIVSVPSWLIEGGPVPPDVLDITITDKVIETGIVHELMHCQRCRSQSVVLDHLDGLLHRDVYSVVTEAFDSALELEIENLAVALVKHFT